MLTIYGLPTVLNSQCTEMDEYQGNITPLRAIKILSLKICIYKELHVTNRSSEQTYTEEFQIMRGKLGVSAKVFQTF